LCHGQKKLCRCRFAVSVRMQARRDVVLSGKNHESTRAEDGIPGFHEQASDEGAKHDLCLQPACPNLTQVACPGCRRPRALDAGCSQSPQQVRLSGNVARIPAELVIRLVLCRPPVLGGRQRGMESADCTPCRRGRRWCPSRHGRLRLFLLVPPGMAPKHDVMCGRDRDPHRSKLDSSPAVDVARCRQPGSPAVRQAGASSHQHVLLDGGSCLGCQRLARHPPRGATIKVGDRLVGLLRAWVACSGKARIRYPGNASAPGPGHRCHRIPRSLGSPLCRIAVLDSGRTWVGVSRSRG